MLQWMTDEYKMSAQNGNTQINTQAIIDTGFHVYLRLCMLGERFLKRANALMITAGLFGTFIGLTFAVGNIGGIMAGTDANTLMSDTGADTLSLLVTSFKGMAVAFVTSLFGTGFSILYMIIQTLISASAAKSLLVSQLEEYLDVKVAAEISESKAQKEDETERDRVTTDLLAQSIQIFRNAVLNLSENLISFKEFNNTLACNMDRIKESASLLGNSMDRTSETVYESGMKIHSLTGALQSAVSETALGNKRLENMGSVLSDLRHCIEDSKKDREIFLKTVYDIPDRLLNYHEAAVASTDRKR